jgi:hypothetical protein
MVRCKAHDILWNEAYTVRRSDEGCRATPQMAVSRQPLRIAYKRTKVSGTFVLVNVVCSMECEKGS